MSTRIPVLQRITSDWSGSLAAVRPSKTEPPTTDRPATLSVHLRPRLRHRADGDLAGNRETGQTVLPRPSLLQPSPMRRHPLLQPFR
jgi:hypothetical protein